jgi:thiamine-phosphate pyrophosphorylase
MLRYAITDRLRSGIDASAQKHALMEQAAEFATSGIDFVQLREKDMEAGALVTLARELLTVLRSNSNSPKLLINWRADIAIAAEADGVHLTSAIGELTPAQIRHLYASAGLPEPVISVSCHALSEIPAARDAAANIILFGPVFEKVAAVPNHPDSVVAEGIGLNLLQLACAAAAPIPVLALGGITPENAAATLDAGAAGVAAIRMFQPAQAAA